MKVKAPKFVVDAVAKAGVAAGKAGLKLKAASPELMLAGGLIAGGAALVAACIATKKVVEEKTVSKAQDKLDDIQKKADGAIKQLDEGDFSGLVGYDNVDDCKKDINKNRKIESLKIYRHLAWELAKKYSLSVFLTMLSVGLIMGSHGVLKKRYISSTLAYKALDEAYKDYRKRVKEAVGEEKEKHLFLGTEESGETTVYDENGNENTVKDIVKTQTKKYSPYEFDWNAQTAPGNWEANSDYNLMFLRGIQNYANDLLHSRGHVFLNEVLDAIGLKRTQEGQSLGWCLGLGDDFVDFGLEEYFTDEYSDASQDGYLKNIHLNMNCDGNILAYAFKKR